MAPSISTCTVVFLVLWSGCFPIFWNQRYQLIDFDFFWICFSIVSLSSCILIIVSEELWKKICWIGYVVVQKKTRHVRAGLSDAWLFGQFAGGYNFFESCKCFFFCSTYMINDHITIKVFGKFTTKIPGKCAILVCAPFQQIEMKKSSSDICRFIYRAIVIFLDGN